MAATTSGQSDKADNSKESTQNLLYRQHVTTTNPTVCANLGVLKDVDPEESSSSSNKKNFTKEEFVRSLVYACRLCDVGNCDKDSCVEFRKTLEKYNPRCGNWRDLEKWALQLAACICSQKNEVYRRDPCKLAAVFTSMDSLVDKYRGACSSKDPAENFAWANGVELSEVLGVLAWLNGIMTGRYEVIQESNRLQKDNKHRGVLALLNGIMSGRYKLIQESNRLQKDNKYGKGGVFAGQIMEAVNRANEYKLCPRRVWAVARSLPGSELNLPALVPPRMDSSVVSSVVAHEEHDRCTFDFCEFSRKDSTAQKQRHEDECLAKMAKNCKRLTFPQQNLVEPALAGNPTAWKLHGQSIIEPNQPFMAISHVWADGTGAGPWEAGRVNECLYDFFCGIAEQFQCEGIWWDTISIPQEDKKARNEAINNMQSNYINARITLIHDLYLRKWEWVDAESACFAIVMSLWFSRGWTSLELAKSGRAKVLFKSGSTGRPILKDLDEDILAKPGEPSSPWRQVATAAIFNLRCKRITGLNDILTALGPRDTSWPKDMAIISRLLAGVEVPIQASQQEIYEQILRKIKYVYREQLFHNSATMIKSFSWCPTNLFDMPLALTSKQGSTPLRIQDNGDVIGNWRVFSLDALHWEDYVWTNPHPLIKLRIQLAMEERKKHLFLVEEGLITRALLVKMFREREKMLPRRRIHCQFVGPVYFTLPQIPVPNEDGVEIEVRIGDMERMNELENEKAAFAYVGEIACRSRVIPYAQSKESGQMWPENKHNKNATLVLNLLEKAADSRGEHRQFTLHAAAEKGYATVVKFMLDEKKIGNLNVQDSMGRTALLLATANGNDEVVELLLERKADPNVADDYERTPLQHAAWGGSKAMVKRLLQCGANRRALDKLGQSALLLAVERGEEDVVQILLEQATDANVSCTEKDKKNAFQIVLHRAAWGGSKAVVRLLLEEGFKLDTKDKDGQTALHVAAERGHMSVVRVIFEKGFKPNTKDKDGQTALHLAAERGHMSVVRVIFEKSSDFANVTNMKGQTALFEAAKNGHVDIVKLLLMKGAEPDFKDDHSRTALFEAAKNGHVDIVQLLFNYEAKPDFKDDHSRTALFEAAKNGHADIVQLLFKYGAKPDFQDDYSRTALSLAAEHGHKAVVELLPKSPVELDQKDRDGKVPLVYAAAGGHLDIVKLLSDSKGVHRHFKTAMVEAVKGGHDTVVKKLLDKGTGIGSKGESETLLRLAAGGGLESLVQLLLAKGVDLNSKDQDGKTPLYYAIYGGHEDVTLLLLLQDFSVNVKDELYSTLLEGAAKHGDFTAVELLLLKMARPGHSTDITVFLGMILDVLYTAARGGHKIVMRPLLRKYHTILQQTAPNQVPHLTSESAMRQILTNEGVSTGSILPTLLLGVMSMREDWKNSHRLEKWNIWRNHPTAPTTPKEWDILRYLPTALRIAGENGKESVVELLLDEGADVNSITNQLDDRAKNELDGVNTMLLEESPHPVLHHAAMHGHEGVVKILLQRDANINYQRSGGNGSWGNCQGQTALHIAAENGHEAIARLLIKKGADFEASFYTKDRPEDRGSTALHLAVKNGHYRVVKMLIDKVDINHTRYDKATALHVAAKEGHGVIARLLINKRANLNCEDCEWSTALSLAARWGHEGIVRLLIHSGAKVNEKNRQGNTALSLAVLSKHKEIAQLLIESGAEVN